LKVLSNTLNGVLLLKPDVFEDGRGFFMETYQKNRYQELGITSDFVQDNLSYSTKWTLRGLHFQTPNPQSKLVQVIQGEIYDVAVDIRHDSPTFGQWTINILSGVNKHQLFIPEGFAHGFCVLSESAILHYKCSDFYAPKNEKGIIWSDPDLSIDWPIRTPVISKKDQSYPALKELY
jgi:dTDP-4-dehydrorhamnose 3,5-epimerase